MGAGQSTSQAHPPEQALHVLRVTPHSPASLTDIEPYFDFVVGFEGDTLDGHTSIDAAKLEAIVEAHEGRVLNLLVWSSKRHYTRGASCIHLPERCILTITASCSRPRHALANLVAESRRAAGRETLPPRP